VYLDYVFVYQSKDYLGFRVDDCRTQGLGLILAHLHYEFAYQGKVLMFRVDDCGT
jgi:hypothetical protein